jgi:hypothetical protein
VKAPNCSLVVMSAVNSSAALPSDHLKADNMTFLHLSKLCAAITASLWLQASVISSHYPDEMVTGFDSLLDS